MTAHSIADQNIDRRSLVKGAAGVAAASLAVSAMPLTHAVAAEEAASNPMVPSFLVKPEPITEFAQTYEYDVVVVGAGEAGLSAVHTALEAGATVACLQNTDTAFTTGNMAASVDTTQTSPAGVAACVSFIN
ncbi:MAG: FAD-binding protein, partial [Coriobacteriia bacterium]|nr:FAD-binding protein [Coriobacteriia bacterium]